jgi:hypothetical protein
MSSSYGYGFFHKRIRTVQGSELDTAAEGTLLPD